MDLLGSIMSSMDKPPNTTTDEEKKRLKERKLQMEKWKSEENKRIMALKAKVRAKVADFMKNPKEHKLQLEPMQSLDRAIVREITEDAGLVSFSFGEDEVDRHVIVWKKEMAPSDDELAVLRCGEEWTAERAAQIKQKREEMEADKLRKKVTNQGPAPKFDYHTKYTHLISMDVGKSGAQDVSANKQYGNVKVENKQDRRTIEETLAERKAKKMKLSVDQSADSSKSAQPINDVELSNRELS